MRIIIVCGGRVGTSTAYHLAEAGHEVVLEYSRNLRGDLRRKAEVVYYERTNGLLQLFRRRKQLNGTGSGRMLADLPSGQKPGTDAGELDIERYAKAE